MNKWLNWLRNSWTAERNSTTEDLKYIDDHEIQIMKMERERSVIGMNKNMKMERMIKEEVADNMGNEQQCECKDREDWVVVNDELKEWRWKI